MHTLFILSIAFLALSLLICVVDSWFGYYGGWLDRLAEPLTIGAYGAALFCFIAGLLMY